MELKKKKKEFKINGLMNDTEILWKKIPCKCDKSNIEKMHPIFNCINCKCKQAEDSMPRKSFTNLGKTINEIKIVRGNRYNDIIGWTF